MVKANELRVYNLVLAGIMTKTITVLNINYTIKDGWMINTHIPIDDIHPIPLSPEWLGMAGFEKHADLLAFSKIENDEHGSVFVLVPHLHYFKITCGRFWYEVKYVHQLQNLYFALTGEELQITTPEGGKKEGE